VAAPWKEGGPEGLRSLLTETLVFPVSKMTSHDVFLHPKARKRCKVTHPIGPARAKAPSMHNLDYETFAVLNEQSDGVLLGLKAGATVPHQRLKSAAKGSRDAHAYDCPLKRHCQPSLSCTCTGSRPFLLPYNDAFLHRHMESTALTTTTRGSLRLVMRAYNTVSSQALDLRRHVFII
jgi:hypothetical protein